MEEKEYLKLIENWKIEHREDFLEGQCKVTFIECLPTGGLNRGTRINWQDSIGYKVYIIHGDTETEIEIVDYERNKDKYLTIKYNNIEYDLHTNVFRHCEFSNILGNIKPKFKYRLGNIIKDDKRDITITDRKYIKNKNGYYLKYYKYRCNKCGFDCGEHWSIKDVKYQDELWIEENVLVRGIGCSCCGGCQIVVEHINSLVVTAPWMISYFQNGYDEAKKYTSRSRQYVYPICPDCERVKEKQISISNIYKNHSIGCSCGDGQSYPEKAMYNLLEQLEINFQTQLTKTTFKWCSNYKYDFYFEYNNEKYIIETHGIQHYEQTNRKGARTLKEEQKNDKLKKELALKNGIKEGNYIVIDCRKSELEWIKEHILESNLTKVVDLSKIDWIKCHEFACSNLVKIACEYWCMGINNTEEIANIMKYNRATIIRWLSNGFEVNWCDYNGKDEMRKNGKNSGNRLREKLSKQVEIFKNEISLGIFPSAKELERQSEKLFGTKLLQSGISYVCLGRLKHYKKYTFKYAI